MGESNFLKREEIEKGLSVLLSRVEDIYLDVPDVLHLLASFIARAVVDEVISPAFLSRLPQLVAGFVSQLFVLQFLIQAGSPGK